MSKLPRNIRPERLIKTLEKMGFVRYKGRGSHIRLRHFDGRWTQVAVHPRSVPPGTMQKILKQAKITSEELEKFY